MTKLEILFTYSNERIRDTWAALGRNACSNSTRIFNEGLLYQVDEATSSLYKAIVFCKKEYIGNLNWVNAKLEDSSSGEISFETDIISPFFTLLLTPEEFQAITSPADNTFVPFKDYFQKTDVIQIPDDEYEIIMSGVGYPFITDEELEYPREKIVKLAIKPALDEYFKWIPKAECRTYPINSSLRTQEFPEGAYSVLHWSVQQAGAAGTGSTTNTLLRFIDESVIGNAGVGGMVAASGSMTGTNVINNWALQRASIQGIINYTTRTHFNVIEKDKKKLIEYYSTKSGELQVYYAMKTSNWNDIEFARLPEVREFAAANVKLLLANLRRQGKSDLPGNIDYGAWITEANTSKERIRKDWMSLVKVSSVIRGGL